MSLWNPRPLISDRIDKLVEVGIILAALAVFFFG